MTVNEHLGTTPGGCDPITGREIRDLFAPGHRVLPMVGYVIVRLELSAGHQSRAVDAMYKLWDLTLREYYAGELEGGISPDTRSATLAFGQSLYCLVGLDGSTLTLDTLDPDNVTEVVFPSSSDQTVVTGDQHGGVRIPGGTLSQPVTISITLLENQLSFPAGPLNTKLDQYGPFFEFKVVPEQSFDTPVIAAACIQTPAGDAPPPSVNIAHNVGNGIEILPTAPVSFLVCDGNAMAPRRSVLELLKRSRYGDAVRELGSLALSALSPQPAYAFVGSGIGGKTKSFSPFGGVDTAVVVQLPTSFPSQPQVAPAGSPVASPPSVLVRTTNGHTPLGGASVTFAITGGGGSLGEGSAPATSTTITTGNDGLATVPAWTLGIGPANSATANASFTLPTDISSFPTSGAEPAAAITITGNPIEFTATSADIIPYQSSGYLHVSGPSGLLPGFEQPSFVPNGWAQGQGAFGSGDSGNTVCALDNDGSIHTPWDNATVATDMLLRRSFAIPGWWSGDLKVDVAIDNDVQIFVNGHDETASASSGFNPTTGFVTHENCATLGSSTFVVPESHLLKGGSNVLAVRARDRGTVAYVDIRLSVTTP